MDLLARREHSRSELRHKLTKRAGDQALVETVLDQLETEHLLSDLRFTEAFVRSRRERGQGPLRIAEELRRRGVAGDLIGRQLDFDDPDWIERAADARQRRFGALPADLPERARQVRFLAGRGFTPGQIRRAMKWRGNDVCEP